MPDLKRPRGTAVDAVRGVGVSCASQAEGSVDKKFIGGGLVLGLLVGIVIDNLALGIMLGLMLGAGVSAGKTRKSGS